MTQSRCNTALQRDLRAAADALSHNSLRVPSLLRDAASRLDEQEKTIDELRRLLRIAVAAWDRVDETVAWLDDDEWYGLAKELIDGKDGEA